MIQNERKMKIKMFIPLVEKYKPTTLDEVYGHKKLIDDVKGWVSQNYLPNVLLTGPEGTGKSLLTELITKYYLGKHYARRNVKWVDASTNNGVEFVREIIIPFLEHGSSTPDRKKVLILEEIDHSSKDSQATMRKPIVKSDKKCVKIANCNYVNKLLKPFRDRFIEYKIGGLKKLPFTRLVKHIIDGEKIETGDDFKECVLFMFKHCNGQPRTVMNKYLEIARIRGKININMVMEIFGQDFTFAEYLFAGKIDKAINAGLSDPKGSVSGTVNYILTNKKHGLSYSGKIKLLEMVGDTLGKMSGNLPLSTLLIILAHRINLIIKNTKK